MPIIVILAVCLDPSFPEAQGVIWRSAGFIFLSASSVKEAIIHFKAGDFDLVLLGESIPVDARERLTFLIRATGSQVPVVSIAGSPGQHDPFADATIEKDSSELLTGLGELLKTLVRTRKSPAIQRGIATLRESA